MAWRTLFNDGVADMAGICTVGSGAAGLDAGRGAAGWYLGRTGAAGRAAGAAGAFWAAGCKAGAETCAAILGATTGVFGGVGRAAAGFAGAAGFGAAPWRRCLGCRCLGRGEPASGAA